MAKKKISYLCTSCGSEFGKWLGRCPQCEEWNTVVEAKAEPGSVRRPVEVTPLAKVSFEEITRLSTGIREFDQVCGGGIVPGSVVLVGGEPGIGKSTLVYELYKPVIEEHGYFVSGQFDQDKQDVPYAPLLQALQPVIQQILAEHETQIALWKDKLFLHAKGIISFTIERARRNASEISHPRKNDIHQTIIKLIHSFSAQCRIASDGLSLAEFKRRDGFFGSPNSWPLSAYKA